MRGPREARGLPRWATGGPPFARPRALGDLWFTSHYENRKAVLAGGRRKLGAPNAISTQIDAEKSEKKTAPRRERERRLVVCAPISAFESVGAPVALIAARAIGRG